MNAHNPYTPPSTPVADAPEVVLKVRKPVAIWLVQILFAVLAAFCVSGLIRTLSMVGEQWSSKASIEKYATMGAGFLQFVAVALLVMTIIGSQRRSPVGRWLSVFLVGGFLIFGLLGASMSTPGPGLNTARIVGYYLGLAIVLGLPALLLWFSCFSKRARAWYSKSPVVEATAAPPAPT